MISFREDILMYFLELVGSVKNVIKLLAEHASILNEIPKSLLYYNLSQ